MKKSFRGYLLDAIIMSLTEETKDNIIIAKDLVLLWLPGGGAPKRQNCNSKSKL